MKQIDKKHNPRPSDASVGCSSTLPAILHVYTHRTHASHTALTKGSGSSETRSGFWLHVSRRRREPSFYHASVERFRQELSPITIINTPRPARPCSRDRRHMFHAWLARALPFALSGKVKPRVVHP